MAFFQLSAVDTAAATNALDNEYFSEADICPSPPVVVVPSLPTGHDYRGVNCEAWWGGRGGGRGSIGFCHSPGVVGRREGEYRLLPLPRPLYTGGGLHASFLFSQLAMMPRRDLGFGAS